jgi:hypothetical protein
MQFNNPTSTKTENKKYDNSPLKKINQPLALAARFVSHLAGARMPWAFTRSASGSPATGRILSRR